MANSIALAQNFLGVCDMKYKRESLTAILDAAPGAVDFVGANVCKVYKLSSDGLGDYSRSNGYPTGSVTGAWETLTLSKDRGVELKVDRFDNEESKAQAFGQLADVFMRESVVPELDAYRFAKMSTAQTLVKADITVGTTDCVDLIDTAEMQMAEDEVPEEGRILYVSPKMYAGIKAKVTRYLANENGVNREIIKFNNMPVIVVPQSRFNTAITLNNGSTYFGFAPTAGGYKINFMIVHPSAVKNVIKAQIPKIFTPDEFQGGDCYALQYRLYHDCFLWDNKKKGIYTHTASTANS